MPQPIRRCNVFNAVASQKCSACGGHWYCGKEHQKERRRGPNISISVTSPYQMGLYAAGQSKTVTPVFIPKSTGSIETLPRDKLSRMLSCAASDVEIVVSPISTLFDPAHHIVCAYNAGSGGLIHPRGPKPGIAFSTAPGELCTHAVHMTRSLVHSFGSQINGSVLFFYLQPGKDFLHQPDFGAVKAAIEAWDEVDIDCPHETLTRLAEVFKENLTKALKRTDRTDYFDAIIFPARESKPFITTHPFRHILPEEPFDLPYHSIDKVPVLGDTWIGRCLVGRTPSRGNLPNTLLIYIRDRFLDDGSPFNKSIQVATKGEAKHAWGGNIVILKQRLGSEIGMDADGDDVKAAIEYVRSYGA